METPLEDGLSSYVTLMQSQLPGCPGCAGPSQNVRIQEVRLKWPASYVSAGLPEQVRAQRPLPGSSDGPA